MEIEQIEERRKAATPGSDICRAIFPIYYLGKLCGLVPVRFFMHTPEGCQARLNIIDLVYSLCILMLLLGAEIWGLWRDMKDGPQYSTRLKSRKADIATCSDVLGIMCLTIVCIVGSPFRWKYLQHVINKLIEVDKKIGVSSAKKARRFTIGLTICSLTYLWLNSILDYYAWSGDMKVDCKTMTDKGPINYVPIYFMYTVIISTEIQYTVSTYNIAQRFVRLNISLKDLFHVNNNNGSRNDISTDNSIGYIRKSIEAVDDIGDKKRWNMVSERQLVSSSYKGPRRLDESEKIYVNRISELIMVHSSLCDAVSLINSTFGVVILAVTITCLLHLVVTPYFLILQFSENQEWIFLILQSGWLIFHTTRLLILVQPSYSTVIEGKRTAVLVSKLLSRSSETNARRELEIFSLQLLHRPLEFSACGLFCLDRALITSIAGAVTTYLVILIQFQNAGDTKGEVDIIRNVTHILNNLPPFQNLTELKITL